MSPKDILAYFGSRANAAMKLKISYQAIRDWDESGVVPEGRQWEIQGKTNGDLKVDPALEDDLSNSSGVA